MIKKVIILLMTYTYGSCFIFKQQESGYLLENFFSLPQQSKYIGLGYVNNSLLNINSASVLNPALCFEIFHKEINFLYLPILADSYFVFSNFTTTIKTKNFYIPLSLSLGNISSGTAEKISILKESYGYTFKEIFTYTNFATSYYLEKQDINLGFNLKIFSQSIDDYYASSVNFDIGITFPLKSKEYLWGISWLNILPTKLGYESFPFILRTSLTHRAGEIFFSQVKIYTEIDIVSYYDNLKYTTLKWGVGTSYDIFKLPLSLCFSLSYYGVSLGFDIEKENFSFSYGFIYNLISPQHRFALGYKFDFYPEETKKLVLYKKQELEEQKKQMLNEYEKQKKQIEKLKEEYKTEQKVALKLSLAKSYIEEKNYNQAKKIIEEVLKISPQSEEANQMFYLVKTYLDKETTIRLFAEAKENYEKGNYEIAEEKLKKILDLDKENSKAFILLKLSTARKFILLKKYNEAKIELFEILKLDPTQEEALELLRKVETLLELEK